MGLTAYDFARVAYEFRGGLWFSTFHGGLRWWLGGLVTIGIRITVRATVGVSDRVVLGLGLVFGSHAHDSDFPYVVASLGLGLGRHVQKNEY